MGNRTDQRHKVKYPYNRQHSTGCLRKRFGSQVCSIWVDVDSVLALEDTCEGVASVINVQVCVECRGVIENTSHGQCRSNVCRAHDDVALSSTSSLCDCVCITLDLEQETLELLNRPATVGVDVEVEYTSSSGVRNSTLLSNLIDGSDDFAVDLSQNLSGENVGEFRFSVQTMDCLKVLSKFRGRCTQLSAHGT